MTVRISIPAYKVYVYGVDVTADVSSLTVTWNDARSPSSAQVVLSSERDRYVTTHEDITGIYNLSAIDSQLPPVAVANDTLDAILLRNVGSTITDPVKARVIASKITQRFKLPARQQTAADGLDTAKTSDTPRTTTSVEDYDEMHGEAVRFHFTEGQAIFHTGDAFRIFIRNPFNANEWYYRFTGKVSDWKEAVTVEGLRTVTIIAEDNLRFFDHARITANPGIFDVDSVSNPDYDTIFRSFRVDRLDNLENASLPEIIYTIVFGNESTPPPVRFEQKYYGVNGVTDMNASNTAYPRSTGVGCFNYNGSQVFAVANPTAANRRNIEDAAVNTLIGPPVDQVVFVRNKAVTYLTGDALFEPWQDAIDCLLPSLVSDVEGLIADSCIDNIDVLAQEEALVKTWLLPDGTVDPLKLIDRIGSHPEIYPVDYTRLMILVPEDLGPGTHNSVLMHDIISNIAVRTEFVSRLSIILDFCKRAEHSFYCNPRGDLIVELPFYSFRPESFGKYATRYTFTMQDICDWESHFEDEKIKTMMISTWNPLAPFKGLGDSNQFWQQPGTVSLPALIPQFGIRSETADAWGSIRSQEAAAYYASFRLAANNADAWKTNIGTVMRLGIGPNRPLYFQARNFIATTRSGSETIAWQSSVTQSMSLNYRRGWSGQKVTNSQLPAFESYGGRMSLPLDFAMLWKEAISATDTNTQELDGDGTSNLAGLLTREQIQQNLQMLRGQMKILAEALNAKYHTNIPNGASITGSTSRSVADNAKIGGNPKSYHLSGLAVDIPASALAQYGLTPQQVKDTILQLQSSGSMLPGWAETEAGPNVDPVNPDHVHFGIGEGVFHRKTTNS